MRAAFMSIANGIATYSEGMNVARRTLNLGILAHVDAGKTTLTERLLYAAGVIDEIGSVDKGTTQTDSLALERQRGITIKSAVVSFAIDDVTVNLIDTPGHPDFIAEVERVLSVLDGAVLVVSAVEGVQPQTRILMRALQRLRIPTLLFVNKIDRAGADDERVLAAISERLTPAIVPLGSAHDLGTRAADFAPWGADDAGLRGPAGVERSRSMTTALLAALVDDERSVPYARLRAELVAQTGRALVHPVFFGSALTGAGVDALMAGSPSCCRPRRATPTARSRARSSRSSAAPPARRSPTSACSPDRANPRPRALRPRPRGQGDGDRRVRSRVGRAASGGRRGRDRKALGPRRRSGSATRSASRRARGRAPVRAADAGVRRRSPRSRRQGARSGSRSPSWPSRTR